MPPLSNVGSSPKTTTPASTEAAGSSKAQPDATGSFPDQKVEADTATSGRVSPDPRLLGGSRREALGTVRPEATSFTNRSSATAGRSDTGRASALMSPGRKLKEGVQKLIKRFFGRQAAPAQTSASGAAAPTDMTQMRRQVQEGMLYAARRGIDASKNILSEKILGEQHTTDDVLRLLTGGDTGIRRATTATQNLKENLRPEQLPPDALSGTPQQWTEQSRAISQMANQIGQAKFSEELDGRFLDYGTSGANNPFNAVAGDHPQLDQPVRNWLADGVNLLDRLLVAQERAFSGQSPLNGDQIADLKSSADEFSSTKPAQDPDRLESAGLEGFTEEVMEAVDKKLESTKSSDSN